MHKQRKYLIVTKGALIFQEITDCSWFSLTENNSQSHMDITVFACYTNQSVFFALLIKKCIKINDNIYTQDCTFPLSYTPPPPKGQNSHQSA